MNKHFDLNMEAVHYRGEAPMWTDLAGGSLQAASGSWAGSQSVLQTGKGRAIAVPLERRMRKLPDVPTFKEQGLTSDAFRLEGWFCAVGPAGMPDELVNRYSSLFVEAGKSERVQNILDSFGIDQSAIGRDGFEKKFKEEGPVWLRLVSDLGLTPV